MIDHLIEIVFKDVDFKEVGHLLIDLSSNGEEIVDYNFTCSSIDIDWNAAKLIEKIFIYKKNFGLFINLHELIKDGFCLPNCGIAVYRNENSINVELNFQLSDLKNFNINNFVENLMKLAKSIATQYHITDYFCGLEPAQDIKTRLFTNDQIGPFFLKS
jgi:hypothetical protein